MFALDSLVFDLVFGADARPTPEQLLEGLGGEEVAKKRMILDPDLDAPQYEMEVSPTVPLRRRGERRLLIVSDEAMRKDPRREPIIPRDLRPEKDRLVALVEKTGARFGRMQAFGSWGDAAVVVRSLRDLRGLALLPWALDPTIDVDGRRRAKQLSEAEFELKIGAFERRLDELDDAQILARIPTATLEKHGSVLCVHVLSDVDGSWDVRKSYELEKRVAAWDLFARIPGARVQPEEPPPAAAAAEDLTPAQGTVAPADAKPTAGAPAAAPPPPPPPAPEPPKGPPITATDVGGRLVLRIPAERFDLDSVTALGRKQVDILSSIDKVSGKDKDRIHHEGCGFIAPLEFLSEVFLEGKPLDRKRFEAEATPTSNGRALEAHLPRFGSVRVLEVGGKRYVTSELSADPAVLAKVAEGPT
jgi:hypothetical protein